MPWELGFFGGRWGRPTVGLYVQHMDRAAAQRAGAAGRFTVQEYLELYEAVDDATLPDFLRRATSGEMLANRRDVDVDRLLTLLTSAGRNPLAFQLGWAQYLPGMLQPLAAAVPPWQAPLDALVARGRTAFFAPGPTAAVAVNRSERAAPSRRARRATARPRGRAACRPGRSRRSARARTGR
jgi:hypothetical protein